jgi:transcriptional regulator with XRE-family HTH domain
MSGERLRKLRKQAGVTVIEIADHLEMTAPAYRRYERGEVDPKISQCQQICMFIGCRIQDIWGAEDVPESVNVSYTAKPGQTVYVKVDFEDEARAYKPSTKVQGESKRNKKVVNGE